MKNVYWVGPRQSDIEDIEILFAGSITIYGNNKNGNISFCKTKKKRINHNIANMECNLFFEENLNKICTLNPKARFLFYNFSYAYEFNKNIRERIIGLNSYDLLTMLDDKIRCRYLLDNIIETIPFITLKGNECTLKKIHKYFPESEDYIVQKIHSSGGEGTYRVDKSIGTPEKILNDCFGEYLISPYLSDAISLNIHVAIMENETICFPPSVQIITEINQQLLYQGADFICYDFLADTIKQKLESISKEIGTFIYNRGYRGIVGIDYLLKDDNLYFMEINPRFQASSQLINKVLYPSFGTSLQEIHLQSFGLIPLKKFDKFDVPYSNFAYTAYNISSIRSKKIYSSNEIISLQKDGFENDRIFSEDENIYLYRCIFGQNICTFNNDKIILHPNIYVEDIKKQLQSDNALHKEYVKISLLNHGVTLSTKAMELTKTIGQIKEAVFDAIDITIFGGLPVNVPINCKFVSLSPFTIDAIDNEFILFFDNLEISKIKIEFVPNSLLNMKTQRGVPYESIINLATDRIRINPAPICVYKKNGIPCKFCNLPEENTVYNFDDIKEVIDYCLKNVAFRHFLIGGGTYSLQGGWEIIIKIVKYIRSKCEKDIYLMSIPPKDIHILDLLKNAGITEVAFNLEIFDRVLASSAMPGKGNIALEQYMSAFKHSVTLWGNTGNVRSLIIYGFDTDPNFLNGIENLCKLGVEPIISIFRPLDNTEFAQLNPPPTADIFAIYQKCKKITKKYSLILGPDCPQCQNNTLSYTEF